MLARSVSASMLQSSRATACVAPTSATPMLLPTYFIFIHYKVRVLAHRFDGSARSNAPFLMQQSVESTPGSMRILERASRGLRREKCRIRLISMASILIRWQLRAEWLPGLVYRVLGVPLWRYMAPGVST